MSNLNDQISKSLEALTADKVISVKKRKGYRFCETEKEARKLFTQVLEQTDTTIKKLVWLPEYDHVVKWMTGSEKGLLISGDVGVGKSNIITKLIPMLFYMQYSMVVKPVAAQEIKANMDMIENSPVVIIDDVGDERQLSQYGIKYRIVEDIVKMCEERSKMLFLTTNLNRDQLEGMYGTRILDRLDFLVTAFRIEGESFR